jgi:hypothetical protein
VRALIFTPDRNSEGKHDYSGAFRPEAYAFAREHGVELHRVAAVDVSRPANEQRNRIEGALMMDGPLDVVAFFCHGFENGIQLGGYRNAHVAQLAGAIASTATPAGKRDVRVVLYACSTGKGLGPGGDGGFADRLRDALCAVGQTQCQVDAHDTAAHTTRNPRVRRFLGAGSPVGGTGGGWVVAPGSPLWNAWRRALRDTSLRLRFPVMSIAEVHAELAGMPETVS